MLLKSQKVILWKRSYFDGKVRWVILEVIATSNAKVVGNAHLRVHVTLCIVTSTRVLVGLTKTYRRLITFHITQFDFKAPLHQRRSSLNQVQIWTWSQFSHNLRYTNTVQHWMPVELGSTLNHCMNSDQILIKFNSVRTCAQGIDVKKYLPDGVGPLRSCAASELPNFGL